MKTIRLASALAGIATTVALIAAPSASAATEFGSPCAAKSAALGLSVVSLAHGPASPLPVTAPVGGILTEWRTNIGLPEEIPPELDPLLSQRLLVLRPGGENQYTLVGSATAPFQKGISTHLARIPIAAGDHLGIGSPFITVFCVAESGDASGFVEEPLATGQSATFEEAPLQVPIIAKIEPDVDGDGYGDETQDACPQSAAYQTPCPVVTIDSSGLAGKKAVTVYVATSLGAPVNVSGSVALSKGKTAALAATAQPVAPGQIAAFTLTLSKPVTKRLKELPTTKKLSLSVTASATNVAGAASTDLTTVKLPGQAAPKPKQAKHHKK